MAAVPVWCQPDDELAVVQAGRVLVQTRAGARPGLKQRHVVRREGDGFGEGLDGPKVVALSVERRREGGELGHLAACASLCLSPMKPGCLHLREKLRLVVVVVVVASVRCSASGHKGVGFGSFHVAISWQTVTTWLAQQPRNRLAPRRPPGG